MGLDFIELILVVEENFGISIPNADAPTVTTPELLISYVQQAVSSKPFLQPCLSQRAFHRVRFQFGKVTGTSRRTIRINTNLVDLLPKDTRQKRWDDFRNLSGLKSLPNLSDRNWMKFSPVSVKDIVIQEVMALSKIIRITGCWSDQEVRTAVRSIISYQLGIDKFKDCDEFVRDLGVD